MLDLDRRWGPPSHLAHPPGRPSRDVEGPPLLGYGRHGHSGGGGTGQEALRAVPPQAVLSWAGQVFGDFAAAADRSKASDFAGSLFLPGGREKVGENAS